MDNYPDKFKFGVSYTTRAIREGEKHGENYYYVQKDKFQQVKIYVNTLDDNQGRVRWVQ